MTATPSMPDGPPRPAPEATKPADVRPDGPPSVTPEVAAANQSLASAITADLQAGPSRLDAALADAAGLPSPEAVRTGLTPDEIQELGNNAAVFIRDHPLPEQSGLFQETTYTQTDLMEGRHALPVELGQRFDAHGIAKGGYKDQLTALNTLLTTGIDPTREFHTVPLKHQQEVEAATAMGAAGPYENGNFIILSHPDSQIRDGGIGAVLVNEAFYDAIPTLQERFPNVRFIKASEMTEELNSMIAESSTQTFKPTEPTSDGREAVVSTVEPVAEVEGEDTSAQQAGIEAELRAREAEYNEMRVNGASKDALAAIESQMTALEERRSALTPKTTAESGAEPMDETKPISGGGVAVPEPTATTEPTPVAEPADQTTPEAAPDANARLSRTDLAKAKFAIAKKRRENREVLVQLAADITLAYEYDLAEEIVESKEALSLAKGGRIDQLKRKVLSKIGRGSKNGAIGELEERIKNLSSEHAKALKGDRYVSPEDRIKQAKLAEGAAKTALRDAKASGDQEAIDKAQQEYNVAREHLQLSDPNKKKSLKRLITELMVIFGLGIGKDVASDVGSTIEHGSSPQRR